MPGLKDLTLDELESVVDQRFMEAGVSRYEDVRDISIAQIKRALNDDYRIVSRLGAGMESYFGEVLADAIATHKSPAELEQEIIELAENGELKLKSLRKSDGTVMTIEQWAQVTARTESYRNFERCKSETAGQLLDDPVLIWRAVMDSKTREEHRALNGKAKRLGDWQKRPGDDPNCRCTGEIVEADNYKGEILTGLLEGKY